MCYCFLRPMRKHLTSSFYITVNRAFLQKSSQQLCKFIGTKQSFYIRKDSTPTGLVWNTNMAGLTSCENSIEIDFLDFEYTTLIKNHRHFYLINRGYVNEIEWIIFLLAAFRKSLDHAESFFMRKHCFSFQNDGKCYLGPSKFQVNIPIFSQEDIILKDCGNLNAECILVVKLK